MAESTSLDLSSLSLSKPQDPHPHPSKNKKKRKKIAGTSGAHSGSLPSQRLVESAFPWKTVNRPTRGRCAVATRVINAGEVVLAECALAFIACSNYRTTSCHACCKDLSKLSPGVECPFCNYAIYCQQCTIEAMFSHKSLCPIFIAIKTIAIEADCDEDLLRLVLLLATRKISFAEDLAQISSGVVDGVATEGVIKEGIIHPSFQDAMGLQSHKDKYSLTWRSSVKKACEALYNCISEHVGGSFRCSTDDLELLAALINTNAHGMGAQGPQNRDVAVGIFPFVSMLNHSCRPNCCFASEGNVMYVRATQDIPQDDELSLTYINLYESRSTRRCQLAMTKHFDCSCPRCMEPLLSSVDRFLEGVVCNVKGCGGAMVKQSSIETTKISGDEASSSWKCDTCSHVLDPASVLHNRPLTERPWDLLVQAQESFSAAVSAYKERHFKDARILFEEFISRYRGKLHPLHVLLLDAYTPLMNCCRALGDAEGGIRACQNVISCLEKVLVGPSLELANFYLCLGEMCLERGEAFDVSPVWAKRRKKQAQEAFQRVRQIRNVCLGQCSLSL